MKKFLFLVVAASALVGCLKSKDDSVEPCSNIYDSCAVKAPAAEIDSVKKYLETNNLLEQAEAHCSGMYYIIDSVGTGLSPKYCSGIAVRYKGMLTNGNVFDSSNVATQWWALNSLIKGWVNGLPLIKQGGGMRLFIPPTLGYGSQPRYGAAGQLAIPANSVLVFEIKLDGVIQ